MNRLIALAILNLTLMINSTIFPALANEALKDPSAKPDPALYEVAEWKLEDYIQLEVGRDFKFGDSKLKDWSRIRLAIPKTLKCDDYDYRQELLWGKAPDNCTAFIRASAETSVNVDPGAIGVSVFFSLYLYGSDNKLLADRNSAKARVEPGSSVGTMWSDVVLTFSSKQSGTVFIKVGANNSFIYRYLISENSIPIQVKVRPKAEVDAEKAASEKAAAEKAAAELKAREVAEAKAAAEAAAAEQARAAEELAEWRNKKLSITCVKGKVTKKVIGDPPVCPAGYTNQRANLLTFQAYSKCKLYKQDAAVGGAQIQDSGRTLALHLVPNFEFLLTGLTNEHFNCATKTLKVPGFVGSKISATRAIDGIQSAKWGKISAFWNYHPEDGLKITFNTK